ncbi:hypothetical protein NBRC110019_03460 [Neptunitalea chrysea]|uniref:PA14 domain-containing protein n=1 Tax=Neptunitalea chrysea TaxID=1647581 RepID=A0A9W6EUG8_9FLAO|nr:alkaline phosphatase family protein [Neptunitalea chrysea]GLB51307.1 hypothetical protein NBRC110019_03460 [Neptunitalea chrysea]
MKYIKFAMAIGIFFLWSCHSDKLQKEVASNSFTYKHIVVIGFDGLSPDGLKHAETPNFDRLITEGASTMQARAVLPTSSSTNWASMIMGAGPEQHGILSNSWERDNFVLPTVVQNEPYLFPTIFSHIRKANPNAEIGTIYHWDGFGRLFEKSAVSYDINGDSEDETEALASAYIKDKNPDFTFIHFDHVDHAGHEFGHGTKEYYESVAKADELLGKLISTIESSQLAKETLVIVSSDHGGIGKGHGGASLAEIEIPFILWGPHVKKGYHIKYPVYQYDNAATVAYGFGLKLPIACIGKPVLEAFEGNEISDDYAIIERQPAPIIKPEAVLSKVAGGLFVNEATVSIESIASEGIIRFTIDGSMPKSTSGIYTEPFKVSSNTVIKAGIFKNGVLISSISDAYFRIREEKKKKPVGYKLFYLKDLKELPSVLGLEPDAIGTCFEFTSDEVAEPIKSNTVVVFSSKLIIDNEDDYRFSTRSDDGSKLFIDGKEVVNNDGDHGIKEKSGKIHLKPGTYNINVHWFNGGGDGWLDVYYANSQFTRQILPTSMLAL